VRKCSRLTSVALETCVQNSPNVSALNLAYCNLSNESLLHLLPSKALLRTLDLSGFRNLDDRTFQALLHSEMSFR
jgi:hypothetical protein